MENFVEPVKGSVGKVWADLKAVAAVITVIAAVAIPLVFIIRLDDKVSTLADQLAKLESRVRTLEERVHTLTVAPAIANTAGKAAAINPVAQACADLARQFIDAGSDVFAGDPTKIRTAMAELGCNTPKQ